MASPFREGGEIIIDCATMTVILTASSVSDLRKYKISNVWILIGWLSGLAFRFYEKGISGMGEGIFCVAVSILLLWPLFIIRGLGAGDIKLLSVISCYYGLDFWGETGVVFLFFAGIVSIVQILKQGILRKRFQYLITYILYDRKSKYYLPERDGRSMTIPLAPLLAIAYYLVYFKRIGVVF